MFRFLLCRVLWSLIFVCSLIPSAFGQERVLRFATWDSNEQLELQRKIALAFEEKNPGVKVQVEAYGTDFSMKIAAAYGAGNPPDVSFMWDYPSFYQSLEALDEYLLKDKSFDVNDLVPGLLKQNQFQGKTYGLPSGFSTRVMFYNKDMFDAAGLAYPTENWTWEDLRNYAKKLRNKDKKQYGYVINAATDLYDFQAHLWSAGSSLISADGKKIQGYFNSPSSKAFFTMFATMLDSEQALYLDLNEGQKTRELFISDRFAMIDHSIWFKASLEKAGKRFGIVGLPRFQDFPVKNIVNNSGIAMAKDSKNKALAWEFIKFYLSPEAVMMRSKADLPVLKSVAAMSDYMDNPNIKPFYDALAQCDMTPAFLLAPRWQRAQDRLELGMQQVYIYRKNIDLLLDKSAIQAEHHLKQR